MDLLLNAYSNNSEEEEEEPELKKQRFSIPSSKPEKPNLTLPSTPSLPISGRYVSKRQRQRFDSLSSLPSPLHPPSPSPFTLIGTILDSDIPRTILPLLKTKAKCHQNLNFIPEKLSVSLHGHTKAVNAIHWSSTHAHLLASAAMDHSVCVWNIWSRGQKKACVLNFHNSAVKDVKWSRQGPFLLSCGYDCMSRLVDVEKGLETQVFGEDQVVGAIKFSPDNSNIFLSGGSKGHIKLWDIRTGKVVHNYNRNLGPVLDVEFTMNGKQFISSSDVSGSNVSENSIIVWDVSRQVPLSNQGRQLYDIPTQWSLRMVNLHSLTL